MATASFDFDSLTLGEVATIEDLCGIGIGALSADKPQGKFLAALVMVMKRRNGEPTFTFNQAMNVPMSEAQTYLGVDTEDDTAEATDAENPGGAWELDAEGNVPSSEPPVTG